MENNYILLHILMNSILIPNNVSIASSLNSSNSFFRWRKIRLRRCISTCDISFHAIVRKVSLPGATQTDVKKYSTFRRNSSAKRISHSSKRFYSASLIRKSRREKAEVFFSPCGAYAPCFAPRYSLYTHVSVCVYFVGECARPCIARDRWRSDVDVSTYTYYISGAVESRDFCFYDFTSRIADCSVCSGSTIGTRIR